MASPTPVNPQWVRPPRRRSVFGPVILIFIGVLFLLVNTGRVSARNLFIAFAQYWPVLLILWGAVKLFEYMQAKREGYPPPGIGGGGVVLLVFIILFGTAISAAHRGMSQINWDNVRNEMDMNDDDFRSIFNNGKKFEFSDNIEHAFPANSSLKVVLERGDIKISASSDDKLHIALRKAVYADSEVEAKKISDNTNLAITTVDHVVNIDAAQHGDWKGGSIDLEIFVPRKAAVELMTLRGTMTVADREGEVKANNSRGDVTLENITGNSTVHLRGGDFKAQNIKGDVNVEGRVSTATASDITGRLSLQGDYDEIQLSKIGKGLHFNSTRTDLDVPRIDGSLNMSRGDLRADGVVGPVRLVTKNKDIHIEELSGDIHLENANASVELNLKSPVGNVEVANQKGDVNLMLPSGGNFTVDASANRGEISTDFELKQSDENHEARANGTVNKGGPRVQVRNDHGTINIRKS